MAFTTPLLRVDALSLVMLALVALVGVVLALLGLLASLFIRPRRTWVRARRNDQGSTDVEVAVLARAGGDDVSAVLADLVAALRQDKQEERR